MEQHGLQAAMEQQQMYEMFEEVLERQHQQLMDRLERWLQGVSEQMAPTSPSSKARLSPNLTMKSTLSDVTATGSSGLPVEINVNQLQRSLTRRTSRMMDGEEGLNSYDLAKRQGSKVDMYKQSMMSESDMLGSEDQNKCLAAVQGFCYRVVRSHSCELFFALMIISNSVYLGVQLEMSATDPERVVNAQTTFTVLNTVYAVIFLVEVCLRWLALGWRKYFFSPGWAWNWLDVFVVTSTWVELAVGFFELEDNGAGLSNSNLRLLRIVKVSRLARVLRILRVVQFVRPLRTLMHCLVDSTKSFIWALILLILMMYVFGLLFTDAVLDHLRDNDDLPDELDVNLRRFFGTVYASMTTLFRSVSNGLDWYEAVNSLARVGEVWVQLYHLYISFISFAVLNVMTGVFCHSAIKAAERDHEMVIQSLLQNKKDFRELVSNLFMKIDDLGLGMITISEFEKHFNDDAVRAFFESLEMGAADAWTLFVALDADGDNVISLKDFTERCMQLHGPARSVDLYALTQQNAKLRQQLQNIEDMQILLHRKGAASPCATDSDSAKVEAETCEVGTHCLV